MKYKIKSYHRKETVEALDAMENEIIKGERYTSRSLAETFFTTYDQNSPFSKQSEETLKKCQRYLSSVLLRRLLKQELPYGKLNEQGYYGIARTGAEARYMLTSGYAQVKGKSSIKKQQIAYLVRDGLLPTPKYETLMIAKPTMIEYGNATR